MCDAQIDQWFPSRGTLCTPWSTQTISRGNYFTLKKKVKQRCVLIRGENVLKIRLITH